ncbi:MAG: hypothetical protein ACQES0_06330 [Bacteroidota bacterium]
MTGKTMNLVLLPVRRGWCLETCRHGQSGGRPEYHEKAMLFISRSR